MCSDGGCTAIGRSDGGCTGVESGLGRHTLTGRRRFAAAADAYDVHRTDAGLPATWEIISAMAWAPEHGAPIREGGVDLVSIPADSIPIRRRR